MNRLYKRLAVVFFGRFARVKGFQKLKPQLEAAGIVVLLKTYVAIIIFTTFLTYVLSLAGVFIFFSFFPLFDPSTTVTFIVTVPVFAALAAFAGMYFYPGQKSSAVRKSIDNDLPFALTHLSALASSGVSPEFMFELLAGFKEYKDISRQSFLIVRNIKTFGMSSVSAINAVANTTPSPTFKQVLSGITFTVEKGGNLVDYLKQFADREMFSYRLRRERYLKTLSTYADIYTALLIAAPLMMLSILGILGVIGGQIVGLTIPELIATMTFFLLPAMNIAFLAFIHLTYPGV